MSSSKKPPSPNEEAPSDTDPPSDIHRGPHGGKTTVIADGALVRKTFYLDRDVEVKLRDHAHRTRRSESEVIRQILRDYYGVE